MKPIVKQKQSTVQDIINKAQAGGGSSTIPDIARDTNGTITLSYSGGAIVGTHTVANDGFINISYDIDYGTVYPSVTELFATFDIQLTRDSASNYVLESSVYFQGTTISHTLTNNNFSVMIPVKAGDIITISLSSKELNQGNAVYIINGSTAKYFAQKYV